MCLHLHAVPRRVSSWRQKAVWPQGAGGGQELVFNKDQTSEDGLHDRVNTLNTTSLCTCERLRWQLLCYVYFTTT